MNNKEIFKDLLDNNYLDKNSYNILLNDSNNKEIELIDNIKEEDKYKISVIIPTYIGLNN